MAEKLYLVDGPSYLYRAYHAIGHLSTSRGIPTNATLGMTMMLWKMLREERPAYMAVAWDAPGPTFRHEQFEAYKIQRPGMPKDLVDQIPWIRKSLDVLGLPVLEVSGFEADDILATAVERLRDQPVELVLVTADKDALQLVGPKVTVLSVLGRTGERIVYDRDKVLERWAVPPERIPDVLALMGDSIDNIPGVPGVGEVTAQKLLRQFGSLEALYENLTVVTGPKLRETLARSRDQAFFSRQLAVLEARVPIDVDLERFRVREPNWERIRPLWTELEFSTLLRQAPARAATVPTAEVPRVDEAAWRDWRGRAGALIAVEPVLAGNPPEQALLGLGCYSPTGGACYLASVGELADLRLAGHDLKALVSWAQGRGLRLPPEGLDDTAVAAYLLNSGRSGYPLEELCLEAADHAPPGPLAGLLEGRPPAAAEPALLAAWAGARAEGVWRLWACQRPLLERDGLGSLYRDLEMPLVPVLAAMENAGIRVAPERLERLAKELERQLDTLLREIQGLAGEPVNPNSPKQLAAVLFEKLKLPPVKRTKTGYSTDVDVLEELALGHPLPQKILEYRQLAKLKGTYADALPLLVNPRTGRIHASFNQLVAATGRLSCLPAGTLVSTQRGLLGIEHVRPGDTVRTAHGPQAVLHWESTGLKPVVALHLSNGIVFRCSPEHRLLTRGEWKEASELRGGDPLYMSFQPGLFGRDLSFDVERRTAYRTRKSPRLPAEWSVPLAELVGYAMADGHMARSNYNDKPAKLVLAFGWDDEELMDHFAAQIDAQFGKAPTQRVDRTCRVLEVSSVDICGLFEQLGAGGRSGTIRVPPSIFTAPEPIVAGFLRGYFEGDGTAKSSLSVRSVSRQMLEGVHHLLTLFGIPSSIHDGAPDPRGYAPRHTLFVVGDRSKRRFRAWINFISERKRRHIEALVTKYSEKSTAETLTLPSSAAMLEIKGAVYDAYRQPGSQALPGLYVFMHRYARGQPTVTLPRIEAFVEALELRGAPIPAFLSEAVAGRYFEVKIDRIEHEPPVPMYEIAAERSHYLAHGIVVHNSSSPNLQNIPIRNELGRRIRQAFIPEDGWRFMAADYSQIELRIFAHLSGEEALLEAFRRDEDIHTRTAAEILHVPADQVTPEMRRLAKVVNFGVLYGISGFGLAQAASISREDAQRYIDAYFAAHAKVRAYIDRTVAEGRERGFVTTLLGRRRYLPELAARNVPARMGAERMAANAPIQGTASDIIKLAMVRLAAALAERGLRARMLLQVHDELLLEVPEAEREPVRALLPEIMESVMTLDVPLRVEVKDGRDWAEV